MQTTLRMQPANDWPRTAVMDLDALERDLLGQVERTGDEAGLEALRVAALGKKGSVEAFTSLQLDPFFCIPSPNHQMTRDIK